MNRNYFVIIYILIIMAANTAIAADFYPEMGMDPFYSSLNPLTVLEEEQESENIINVFKNIKEKREAKKQEKIQKKKEAKALKEEIEKTKKVSEQEESFVTTQPKKSLTKIELEKELRKEEKEREKALKQQQSVSSDLSLKERFLNFKNSRKSKKQDAVQNVNPNIELVADYMEYFPERYEVEAIGNARALFTAEKTMISAHKIVYNYDVNIITASENVVLTNESSITEGDFVRIDLKKPEGWIENPVTTTEDIKLTAKEAYIFSDKIEEYEGVAKIEKDEVLNLGGRSFATYVDQSGIFRDYRNALSDESKGIYKIKANTIYIDAKEDHNIITVKNGDLFLRNRRVATIPSIKIITNKQRTNVETNIPEFGSQNMLGMHFGPAVVLNVPGGSTLKLAPILTYKDDKFGIGGIARYRSDRNMTELAYGTSKDEFLIRGRHKIASGLTLHYSRYTNENEWFLGYRMPKYSAHLDYKRTDYVPDLKVHFSQLYSAGVFVDRRARHDDFKDAEGRFRWMTQTYKSLYKYSNEEGNIAVNAGLVAQTVASVYTSGERLGLFRVGPSLSTQVGPWRQSLMYYQSASDGKSPFFFDRYRYGRSNFVVVESLKLSKYITVGYLASLAMNNDYHSDKLFQESRILVSVGPEYARFTIGYDAYRRNTMFLVSMLVGTKDSDIEFKKTVIQNPDKLSKKKKEKKPKKKSYKKYLNPDVAIE